MSKIYRRNIFTDVFEWVEVDTSNFTKSAVRDERKEYSTRFGVAEKSIAAGCNSTQVADFNEFYKERGIVGARHLPDGTLEYDSQGSFNEVLKLRGLFNRDAGYGDWAGNASD